MSSLSSSYIVQTKEGDDDETPDTEDERHRLPNGEPLSREDNGEDKDEHRRGVVDGGVPGQSRDGEGDIPEVATR